MRFEIFFYKNFVKNLLDARALRYACALRIRAVTIAMNGNPRDNLASPTHGSQLVINTGYYQRFIHPHVTRSPPIGIAKLSEVFMN